MKFKNTSYYSEYPWPAVILFHDSYPVINRGDIFHRISASTNQIVNIVRYLKAHYKIIDEQEFLELSANGFKNSDGKILLTFDDASRGVYSELFTFFNEEKIKPLIFYVAGFVAQTHLNWPAIVSLLFRHSRERKIMFQNNFYNLDTLSERVFLFNLLMSIAKSNNHREFLEDLNSIFCSSDYIKKKYLTYDSDMNFITEEETKKIIRAGWGIGSHSYSHFPLTSFSSEELDKELSESKNFLQNFFNIKINTIAYPHGSCNDEVIKKSQLIYKAGFIAHPEKSIRSNFEIPRFSFPGDEHIIRSIAKLPRLRKKLFLEKKEKSYLPKKVSNLYLLTKLIANEPIDRLLLFQKVLNKLFLPNDRFIENKGIDLGDFHETDFDGTNLLLRKKILIICGADSPMRMFVSNLSSEINLSGVLIQNVGNFNIKVIKSSMNKTVASAEKILSSYLYPYFQFENISQQNILGNSSLAWFVQRNTKVFQFPNVNDDMLPITIRKINPDIIFVFGTGMIKNKEFLNLKQPVYNLHWGYSPYYRGSYTLQWPVVNNDLDGLCITAHKLNTGIDAGPIVLHQKLTLDGAEDSREINYKAAIHQIEMVKKIINIHENNMTPVQIEQNLNLGKLYKKSDWNDHLDKLVDEKLEDGFVYKSLLNNQCKSQKEFIKLTSDNA